MFDMWQVNLLLFYIFTVAFFQFYKLTLKTVERDSAATIVLQTIAGVAVLLLVPFFEISWPSGWFILLLFVASCVFYAANDRMQLTARKHLTVANFLIIGQLSTIFVILYGLIVFQEEPTWSRLGGAALIILANLLIFYRATSVKFKIGKYELLAIIASFIFATALIIDVGISKNFNLPIYISLTLLLPAVLIAIASRTKLHEPIREFRNAPKLFLLTGIFWAFSIFFSLRALQLGEVSVVITLQAVAVILNVAAAYVFLNERDKIAKKIVAAVLILFGVLLTTL